MEDDFDIAIYIDRFLRTHKEIFEISSFYKLVKKRDKSITRVDAEDILMNSIYALSIPETNEYITLAGFFTDESFSIKPKRAEVQKGVFIVGGRGVPFTDPTASPEVCTIIYNGKVLPKKVVSFPINFAFSIFREYNPEFAIQKILEDPINDKLNLPPYSTIEDEGLPKEVNLSVFDLSPIIEKEGFSYGDRIICTIINWDKNILEIHINHASHSKDEISDDDIKRNEWYENFEKALLQCFSERGPCASIQEQLLFAIFYYDPTLLCEYGDCCGSIEEYLESSKVVSFVSFGVESRLWKKGEEIPAIGPWTEYCIENGCDYSSLRCEPLDEGVISALLGDIVYYFLLTKDAPKTLDKIIASPEYKSMFGEFLDLMALSFPGKVDKRFRKELKDYFSQLFGEIWDNCDEPAERKIVSVMHDTCILFKKVYNLTYEVLSAKVDLASLPAENVITLRQLCDHLMTSLIFTQINTPKVIELLQGLEDSIEGMGESFDMIKGVFLKALAEKRGKDLTVS